MKLVALVLLLGTVSGKSVLSNNDLDEYWKEFKRVYEKSYRTSEENIRRGIWEKNVDGIIQHNLEADMGKHTYRQGINEYSDMEYSEVLSKMTGLRSGVSRTNGSLWIPPSNVNIPDKVDWRDEGLVTPVKNQGGCGSCWAFSTTGSLEGQHKKKTGTLVSLSEQNLVDCAKGNSGCNGGWMDIAFQYVNTNKGIDTETSYPYIGKTEKCQFVEKGVGATCTGFVDIPSGDEESLKQAVATVGPISVAIDSTGPGFGSYKSGVYDEPTCRTDVHSHAVLIVGYGTLDGVDYWLVKNSWGETWGMKGYIMMSRNKNDQCGIATKASYPLV